MKILFVRTYCPNPIAYGSELRSSRFVDYFRAHGQVDLLTLTAPTDLADMAYIKKAFDKFYYFEQRGSHKRLRPIEKLIHLLPWQITGHYAKDLQHRLNEHLEREQYDLIFVFKLEPVFYFLNLKARFRKRVIIDFDDILSDLYRNHYKGFTAIKNSISLKHYENRALKEFNKTFVCAAHALNKIADPLKPNVAIVPNVYQFNPDNFLKPIRDTNRFLFVGSLDYFPNTEGLQWFFKSVWPQLKKEFPAVEMTVVGKARKSEQEMRTMLGNPKDVIIAMNVPSVFPYYENTYISIVPLLNGSGTRLKILESVTYNRPVISTPKGAEGLDFKPGRDIYHFTTAGEFIQSYKDLLDPVQYDSTGKEALKVVCAQYSPEAFNAAMDKCWDSIIRKIA